MNIRVPVIRPLLSLVMLTGVSGAEQPEGWWNPDWTARQPIEVDGSVTELSAPLEEPTVLVRLPYGSFDFATAKPDGSDLRFVAEDGKTLLPYQIESFDSSLGEGFIWVRLPELAAAAKTRLHLYYGNAQAPVGEGEAHDPDTALVYHFSNSAVPPQDASGHGNHAETPGTAALGGIIGQAMRPLPGAPVMIPVSDSLRWQQGQPVTFSWWMKPDSLQESATVLAYGNGTATFRVLLDQGAPVVQLGAARSDAGEPLAPAVWSHLAVVADGSTVRIYVNGKRHAEIAAAMPELDSPIALGGMTGDENFAGEFDEFAISRVGRPDSWVAMAAVNQGAGEAAQRMVTLGAAESAGGGGHSGMLEHLSLFKDIAGNMMFDGWIAIGICAIMIVIGWTVAVRKFIYLNSIEKGTRAFLNQWKHLATDLTALDPDDQSSVGTLGGKLVESERGLIEKSPLYHIYQIGSEEIRHRLDKDNNRVQGLSGRSIQAIRASLDAGLVHESHRLSDGLVYLTISIAGGPYVGLLGTVVGVMITFAIIARSGEVNVNSIAPGIASALLATVVGLVVAIPALFIYSYLNGRIKNSLGLMQVFIDEFVAKMAEFYRPPNVEPDQGRMNP